MDPRSLNIVAASITRAPLPSVHISPVGPQLLRLKPCLLLLPKRLQLWQGLEFALGIAQYIRRITVYRSFKDKMSLNPEPTLPEARARVTFMLVSRAMSRHSDLWCPN